MIHLEQAIVVEGKYDRIKLSELTDAPIIETGGFNLYHDSEKKELIRRFAKEKGIIILTDSDPAGMKLRSYISDLVNSERVYHAYVPEIKGKEHRKAHAGAAGILGVEGIEGETIEKALLTAVSTKNSVGLEKDAPITVSDWYEAGLTGKPDSKKRRSEFLRAHGLPGNLSQ